MSFRELLDRLKSGKTTARNQIRRLIEMALADGTYSKEEIELLTVIASRNGISESRIREIRDNKTDITVSIPSTDSERFRQVYDLVRMMLADKSIHPEELRVSELYASRFGYPKSAVRELIETIKMNILNGNNPEDTYERVQYYLKVNELRLSAVPVKR